jgi:diguanylate cyclase (GGDEF)-like protein
MLQSAAADGFYAPRVRFGVTLLALTLGYFLAARFGLWLATTMNSTVSAVWPASGLAIAALLLLGWRYWPAILLGAFFASLFIFPWYVALAVGVGCSLEALAALWLLNRSSAFHTALDRVQDVVKLAFFAAPLACAVSASVGVAALAAAHLLPPDELARGWFIWWMGDMMGCLLVAPALMVWWVHRRQSIHFWTAFEASAILLLMLATVGVSVLTGVDQNHYVLFAFLIWAALRFGVPGVTLVTLAAATLGMATAFRPMAGTFSYIALFDMQILLSIIALSGLLVAAALAERKHSEWRLDQLARFDGLTGLANRAAFQEQLVRTTAHVQRHGGNVALLYLDLDGFKQINDTLGHQAGDQLLQIVAARIQASVCSEDFVARIGGDEFTVLVVGEHAARAAAAVAQKILHALAEPLNLLGRDYVMAASIGIGVLRSSSSTLGAAPTMLDDAHELLRHADTAMYRAKQQRCGFLYFNASMNVANKRQLSLEGGLRRALEQDEFELYYQPKVDAVHQRITGAEALLRWRHPKSGLVLPSHFIPAIEAGNLMEPIGLWVLRQACQQIVSWQRDSLPGQRVAVNFSTRQFALPNLLLMVDQVLQETGLDAGLLEVEITESTAMTNTRQTLDTLNALKQRGVRLTIDDFGTGYSSLAYLKRFPIDAIKIDRSFIQELGRDEDDAAIVRAIIQLAHSMRMRVIAEGVETAEQRDFLLQHGCDEIQGFLYSGALPAADYATLLRTGVQAVRR